jgi:hypothetical protein
MESGRGVTSIKLATRANQTFMKYAQDLCANCSETFGGDSNRESSQASNQQCWRPRSLRSS